MAPGLELEEYQASVLSELNPEASWMVSLFGEVMTTNQEA